jgi:hypothetical protein
LVRRARATVLWGIKATATGAATGAATLAQRAQPELCESAFPPTNAKANKAQLSAMPHCVRDARKLIARAAANFEASLRRTTGMTASRDGTSLDTKSLFHANVAATRRSPFIS